MECQVLGRVLRRRYVRPGFGGVGSAVFAGSHIGFVGISMAFGLSLLAMVYTNGPISGCHVNPAVTLGVFLVRKINAKDAAAYMVAGK
jgi:aquaporin Z